MATMPTFSGRVFETWLAISLVLFVRLAFKWLLRGVSSSSCCRLGRSASAATGVGHSDHCYYPRVQPSDEEAFSGSARFFVKLPELACRHTLGARRDREFTERPSIAAH